MKRKRIQLQPKVKLQMRLTTLHIVVGTALILALSICTFLYMNLGNNTEALANTMVNNTALRSGDWSDPTIWSVGRVPAANDNITIPAGMTVNITRNITYDLSTKEVLNIMGTLHFSNGDDLRLGTTSELHVYTGGKVTAGNGSSRIYIGATMLVYKGNEGTMVGPTSCNSTGCNENVTLPITLVSFTAQGTSEGVELKWVTAKEENNAFFTIERSADASNFTGVQKIKGAINSNYLKNYHVNDPAPVGTHYYRLRQTDLNGESTVSKIVSVNVQTAVKTAENFKMYPNPASARDELNLELDGEESFISLMDKEGNIIATEHTKDSPKAQIHLGQLTPGLYFVKVQSGNGMNIQRLIIR